MSHLKTCHVARAVVPEIAQSLELVLAERLRLQRRQVLDFFQRDSQALADATAEVVLHHVEVPEHPLLDGASGLSDQVDEVRHEVIALPVLHQQVPLSGLRVVIGPGDPLARQPPHDLRPLLVVGRVLGLPESAGDRRLVVDVGILTAVVDVVRHLSIAEVRRHDAFFGELTGSCR